jgi:hypothetical protein
MHCSTAHLFDHLVGTGEQCWRDIEPERLRRFEVDDQLELCGLFNGKVCGAFSFENATDIVARAPEQGWVTDFCNKICQYRKSEWSRPKQQLVRFSFADP